MSLESDLKRWVAASLIDAAAADRIRQYERSSTSDSGLRWPVLLAVALGVVMLGAGVLLFVSAHWDELSPAARMTLVVVLVAIFHMAGALSEQRFETMSVALHTIGTAALGAGIALTGQIFHLDVHWPAGIMLWALGAVAAWAILRHWTQGAAAAILIPYWLAGEWSEAMRNLGIFDFSPAAIGAFLLAVTYLTARTSAAQSDLRAALTWIGAAALIPSGIFVWVNRSRIHPAWPYQALGWGIAVCAPLLLAFIFRRRAALYNIAAAAWAVTAYFITEDHYQDPLILYPWFALGSIGLIAWGIRERRIERINLGIAAFALTVLAFYFSRVMDKIGRSASLIGLGILFLAGGWLLERTRRRLIAQVKSDDMESGEVESGEVRP